MVGDQIQRQQVILNLAINAIDAMAPTVDRPRELVIRSGRPGRDHVTIAVQDSGVGIEPDDLDRLFNPFFSTKPGGMGMGLSIRRSIVEAHGGRLWGSPTRRTARASTSLYRLRRIVSKNPDQARTE